MVESLSLELAAAKESLAKSERHDRDLEADNLHKGSVLTAQNKIRRQVMFLVNTCVQPCARNRTSLYETVSDSE